MKVGELFFEFGATGLVELERGLDTLQKSVITLTATFVASAGSLGLLMNETLKYTESLRDFNRQTGLSTEGLQRYGQVANQTGSDLETIKNTFIGLNSKVEAFKAGIGDMSDFARFGIDIRGANGELKNGVELLDSIRARFKNMEVGKRNLMLDQLGIDKSLIDMLELTNEEFDELINKDLLISDEDIKNSQALKRNFDGLVMTIKGLVNIVMISLVPEFNKVIEVAKEFIMVNKTGLMEGLKSTIEVAGWFVRAIANSVVGVLEFTDATIGLENAMIALGVAFMATPFGRFLAILTAIVGVIDDIYTYFKGGQSITGDIFGSKWRDEAGELSEKKERGEANYQKIGKWVGGLFGGGPSQEEMINSGMSSSSTTNNNASSKVFNDNKQVKIDIYTEDPERAGESVKDYFDKQTREVSALMVGQ